MNTLSNPDVPAFRPSISDHRPNQSPPKLRSLRFLCALGSLLSAPLVADPLDGSWRSFSQGQLPTQGQAYRLSSDSLGTVYFSTAKTTFTYDGYRFDSLAVVNRGEVAALINSPGDYW